MGGQAGLTVNVELDGCFLASRDGLIHAAAGEDPPDVQVGGVDEEQAGGGFSLAVW